MTEHILIFDFPNNGKARDAYYRLTQIRNVEVATWVTGETTRLEVSAFGKTAAAGARRAAARCGGKESS